MVEIGGLNVQIHHRFPQNASISTGKALKLPKTLKIHDRSPNSSRPLEAGEVHNSVQELVRVVACVLSIFYRFRAFSVDIDILANRCAFRTSGSRTLVYKELRVIVRFPVARRITRSPNLLSVAGIMKYFFSEIPIQGDH